MGNSMSNNLNKDIEKVLKSVQSPSKCSITIAKPNQKVELNYFKPLRFETEEVVDQEFFSQQPALIQKQNSNSTIFQSNSYFTLSHIQEIKVKWNYFAKVKQKNYLFDYEVIKKIGQGGFGIVNKVRSLHTQEMRAAKVIKKKDLKKDDHKKLLDEVSIMRSLDHPNIIKIYEMYDYKDQYILILQIMTGGQLYRKVKNKKLPQNETRFYMRQIIRSLIYLHSQGVVHRDLKPQNMLFQNAESKLLKIIDFGIATKIKPNQFLQERIGTPCFIAPEVIYKKYNQSCDVWSAGVIFYMMITGVQPFKADNEVNLLHTIRREEPKFDNAILKKFSPECQQLLRQMLRKKPQKRPSAAEVYNHKWFSIQKQEFCGVDQQKQIQILSNIQRFNFKSKLQAVVYTFIASQLLSNEDKSTLLQIFKQIDLNHDGVISTEQLKKALDKKNVSQRKVQFLLKIIDTNQSGFIQYTEFLVAGLSSDNFMKKQYFQKTFSYLDNNRSGEISYEEVLKFLENYQESELQIQKMFKEVDRNGDGEIGKDEFITLFIQQTSQLKLLYGQNYPWLQNIFQTTKVIPKKHSLNS